MGEGPEVLPVEDELGEHEAVGGRVVGGQARRTQPVTHPGAPLGQDILDENKQTKKKQEAYTRLVFSYSPPGTC